MSLSTHAQLPGSPKSNDPLAYLSASRLKCWNECRLKWYFRYVERIPTVTSPALLVGRVTHSVLQAWNLARWRGEDASIERMRNVLDTCWVQQRDEDDVQWDTQEAEEKQKTKCWSILDHYLTHSPIPLGEKPEAVEVGVERDLVAHGMPPLRGVIDLVREGGKIVDFKTTARTPHPEHTQHVNELQLGCYALLYREATGHTESGFEIHSLVKTKEPRLVVTPLAPIQADRVARLVSQMESYVRGVAAEDYVPSPGMHCAWCDYFTQCRAWKGGNA